MSNPEGDAADFDNFDLPEEEMDTAFPGEDATADFDPDAELPADESEEEPDDGKSKKKGWGRKSKPKKERVKKAKKPKKERAVKEKKERKPKKKKERKPRPIKEKKEGDGAGFLEKLTSTSPYVVLLCLSLCGILFAISICLIELSRYGWEFGP